MTRTPRDDLAVDHYTVLSADHADGSAIFIADESGNTILVLSDEGVAENDTTWTPRA